MEKSASKCFTCGREAYFYSAYLKQNLCKKHFEKMLIRRVRSALISKGYKQKAFRMTDDGSAAYRMLKFVFKKDDNGTVTLENSVLEDFALAVLEYFLTKKKPAHQIGLKTRFNPLYQVSEEELYAFLDMKGIKYKKKTHGGREGYLLDFMKDVEKRRPGGMLSAVKMGEKIGVI